MNESPARQRVVSLEERRGQPPRLKSLSYAAPIACLNRRTVSLLQSRPTEKDTDWVKIFAWPILGLMATGFTCIAYGIVSLPERSAEKFTPERPRTKITYLRSG